MFDYNRINEEVFADPTVDFTFKRIFGTEKYKAATIGLLNSLITDHTIVDVKFLSSELIGETGDSRKAYIDVLCEDDRGEKFVVEMQKARQEHFRERALFYASKLISMMPPQGRAWNYSLTPSYVIAFLNFEMKQLGPDGDIPDDCYLLHYVTRDLTGGGKMPGSTEFFFLGTKDFIKLDRLPEDYPEKWLYLLGKTKFLKEIPAGYGDNDVFGTYFEACKRAGFNKEEEQSYITDMMNEWDIANAKREACERARAEGEAKGREEGKAEGLAEGEAKGRIEGMTEGKAEVAKNLLAFGIDIATIVKCTGLDTETINSLAE